LTSVSDIGYSSLTAIIDVNKWELIFDFTKDGEKKNFEHLEPSEFEFIEKTVEGDDAPIVKVFPYP
jgi:hypothetical protein